MIDEVRISILQGLEDASFVVFLMECQVQSIPLWTSLCPAVKRQKEEEEERKVLYSQVLSGRTGPKLNGQWKRQFRLDSIS